MGAKLPINFQKAAFYARGDYEENREKVEKGERARWKLPRLLYVLQKLDW